MINNNKNSFFKIIIEKLLASTGVILTAVSLGLFFLYVKHDFLAKHWYSISRHYDFSHPDLIPFDLKFSFYFQDIINTFFYLPLLSVILIIVLGLALSRIVVLTLAIFFTSLAFYQMQAFSDSGAYLSMDLLIDGMRFFIGNFSVAAEYIHPEKIFKLVIFLMFMCMLCFSNLWLNKINHFAPLTKWYNLVSGSILLLGVLSIVFISFNYSFKDQTKLHTGGLQTILAISFDIDNSPVIPDSSIEKILLSSDKDTLSTNNRHACEFAQNVKKKNIILFVLETAPDSIVDWDSAINNNISLNTIKNNWVRSHSHFTTYPYTSDAIYSILSGMYPLGRRSLLRGVDDEAKLPALFSLLQQYQYTSAVFVPSMFHAELDEKMFKVFGADKVYVAAHEPRTITDNERTLIPSNFPDKNMPSGDLADINNVLALDLNAYSSMKEFISAQLSSEKNYAAMFLPQIGHAPWKAVVNTNDLRQRGRKLVDIQLYWLNDLVSYLQDRNQLENTIIIVTSDHGIRTRVEDPSLPLGQLNNYSFNVPLLIFAGNETSQYKPNAMTSHVDLMASLLAMNGINEWIKHGQGIPLWCRKPDDRIYFFAKAYGGVDGYTQYNYFTMVNGFTGHAYNQAREMNFSLPEKITMDYTESDLAANRLRYQESLQIALAKKLKDTANLK